jgi:RHS repeat-associated protein
MPVNTYITANGRIRRRITTDEEKVTEQVAVVTNALGSVGATYKDGWLTADRSYDPYGETRAEWNDVGRFGWVGGLGYRETRREWVSHYVRARHYGYSMGMWTSVDPLWPEEAAFGYVGGMPVAYVDPFGLQGNAPPRRMGPPITMRDRPRPANRPPRNNHGRGRPTPVLPVPQPKPPGRTRPSRGPAGRCRLVRCEQHKWRNPIATHVLFCFQTGNPNKSCQSDIFFWQRNDAVTRDQSCREWAAHQRDLGIAVNCFEEEIDCRLATLACMCIKESAGRPSGLFEYAFGGTCYQHARNILDCACSKLSSVNLSLAFDAGCSGPSYRKPPFIRA